MKFEDFEIEGEDFAAMLEESEKNTETNSVTEGEIVIIGDDNFTVSIAGKEGRIPLNEITNADGTVKYSVGDTITVMITGTRGENLSLILQKSFTKS